jgi:hypothetical protein
MPSILQERAGKYIAASSLAIYSHNLALFILPAQFLTAFSLQPAPRGRIRVWATMVAILLIVSPLFPIAINYMDLSTDWITAAIGRPGAHSLKEVGVAFSGAMQPPRVRKRALEFICGTGIILFSIQLAWRWWRDRAVPPRYVLLFSAFAVPISGLMIVSQLMPTFIVRYVMVCLPFFLAMAAVGWIDLPWRWAGIVAVAALALTSLWADWTYFSHPNKPDWEQALHYLGSNARAGDSIAFVPAIGRLEFDYNVLRFGPKGLDISVIYPPWDSSQPDQLLEAGDPLTATQTFARVDRLWIIRSVLSADADSQRTIDRITMGCAVTARSNFRQLSITFCGHNAPVRRQTAHTIPN